MMAFSHSMGQMIFLLTPLREGRPGAWQSNGTLRNISTHAPAGGATHTGRAERGGLHDFYSRPCGRGDVAVTIAPADTITFLLTPLREGRRQYAQCERRFL